MLPSCGFIVQTFCGPRIPSLIPNGHHLQKLVSKLITKREAGSAERVTITIKPQENAVFENAQIEVPGCGGVGGGCAPSTPATTLFHTLSDAGPADSIATTHSAGPVM